MKQIFRTDLSLVIFGLASLVSGIMIHQSGHFATHGEWHGWSIAHCIINLALVVAVAMHVKQHWGWFKKLFRKSTLKAKMPVFVTIASVAVILSGLYLLLFVEGQGSHAGLVHYWIGMIFGTLAILHLVRRWKVFRKGVFGISK